MLARSSGSLMSSVLVATLIADPSNAPLSEATLDRAAQGLRGVERRRWLDEGVAADLVFTGDLKARRAALEESLSGEAIDVIVQPLAHRRKRLLVADMDSTLIGQECVDELADFAGVGDRVAAITERAMRGEVAFAPALRERVALLAGLPETAIHNALKDRITLNRGARTLVQTMRANGAYVAIVSGGFRQFTAAIWERLGADEDRANGLMIDGGKLTGKIKEPILGEGAKLAALERDRRGDGARARGDAGGGRRRERSSDAASRRPRNCVSREAQGLGCSGRAHRAHRSCGAALCAGIRTRRFRRGVSGSPYGARRGVCSPHSRFKTATNLNRSQ